MDGVSYVIRRCTTSTYKESKEEKNETETKESMEKGGKSPLFLPMFFISGLSPEYLRRCAFQTTDA